MVELESSKKFVELTRNDPITDHMDLLQLLLQCNCCYCDSDYEYSYCYGYYYVYYSVM